MFADPEKNVRQFYLKEGWRVADFGAGSGAYAVAAAKRVGETGSVLAVEVQKELVAKVQKYAQEEGVDNVEVLWGDIEELGGSKIADKSVDAVILANVLFQVEDKRGLLSEVKRVLVPGGKVFVIDWTESFGGVGPQPDMVISLQEAKRMLGEAGFASDREFDAGERHYGFAFTKP